MFIENLVGLHVSDHEVYQKYRNEMTPLLKEYGGDFGYNFHVSEVLKCEDSNKNINRLFTTFFKIKSQ